jgi:hypothetical protein
MFDDRMYICDHGEGFGRIEGSALWEFDQHFDWVGTGKFGVKLVACRHCLLSVWNLIGKPVSWLEAGVDERETGHNGKAYDSVKPGPADHACRNPTAEAPQCLNAKIGTLDLGREACFVA